MDILFVIGLPRSGTSLVHKLVHEQSGRKAPTFKSFGIDVSRVPERVRSLNKAFKDESSLAEDNDFPVGDLIVYRDWLETRGDRWVCKSPDHISRLDYLMDVFPEARFLWCLRPAEYAMASVREYFQVTGLRFGYYVVKAVKQSTDIATSHPEKFDCIWTPSIPEWESDREPIESREFEVLNRYLQQVKGVCRNVSSGSFKDCYS